MSKILLIDIDGTICEDIPNEQSHLFKTAKVLDGALEFVNKEYNQGNMVTFFTSRTSEHRQITEEWLQQKGFRYHSVCFNKPRFIGGNEYVWIDNHNVRGIVYNGDWEQVKRKI